MHYRRFANTSREVSEIGLGTWQIGGTEWGDVSDEQAIDVLRASIESGVTFIDTADIYGGGRSESLIGRFLREEKPANLFIATKLGRSPTPGWPHNFSLKVFREHTEGSLQRLGVDAIDLTQLHCIPPEHLKSGEPSEWLATLKKEGKIRHYGASVETISEALYCVEQPGVSAIQIIFNIFRQKALTDLFQSAKHHGVSLIIRLPLASGLLSGKMTRHTKFAPTDHRSFNRNGESFNVGETFAGLEYEKGIELVDEMKPSLPANMTMAQMALRWCLDHDAVTTVIPGAKRPDQARANAAASDLPPLGDELHEKLRAFYLDRVATHIRGPY